MATRHSCALSIFAPQPTRVAVNGTSTPPAAVPPYAAGRGAIRLLEAEPDLAHGLPAADRDTAVRQLVVPAIRVRPGPWTPLDALERSIGVVVIKGLILATQTRFGTADMQLFGPGDVIDARSLADANATWRALIDSEAAVLDARIVLAARRWPQLVPALVQKIFDGQDDRHLMATIRSLPRVEDRLLALLSHLACRWGCVTPDGVALALPATHATLGVLVGARRPTVSLALTTLRERGVLTRMDDGRWLLPVECDAWLAGGVPDVRRALRV